MHPDLIQALSHVLWIGGATDTGKTTIARMLAEKHGLQVYNYDRHDRDQIERLAQTDPHYRAFLDAPLEERWITPEPEELLEFSLHSFKDRFPLVVAELLELPKTRRIVAEGFGFTPALLLPVLASTGKAVWLVPSEEFKRASMERRNKPSFKDKVSDPERAFNNIYLRDMLFARYIHDQANQMGLKVLMVDGACPIEEMAALVEQQFGAFNQIER